MLDETDSKPELIGDALIPLKKALESNPVDGYDEWHQLTYKGKYAGEVYLEMTFYPTTPPIKKKRTKTMNKEPVSSDSMQQSQLYSNSQHTMDSTPLNMTTAGTRPLPEQPGSPAASVATSNTPAQESAPSTNVLPPHMQQTNISSHLQYCQNTLPLVPHQQQTTYSHHHNNNANSAGFIDMSSMSRTLPNPFEYQEFGNLPAILPEHHHNSYFDGNAGVNNRTYHHSNSSNVSGFGYIPEEEEDPMAIFSRPLPPGPNDTSAASKTLHEAENNSSYYQQYNHSSNNVNGNNGDDDRAHRSRNTHKYTPSRSSPLSQSTGSDFSEPETPPPNMPSNSASQIYYQEFGYHQQQHEPYYYQNSGNNYYYPQDQHYGSDLPPVPPAHGTSVAASTAPAPKRSAIRRKPISRRDPGGSTSGELPFSAESYNSSIPVISVSPSDGDDNGETNDIVENRRHSAPVSKIHARGLKNSVSSHAASGAKPLPRAPAGEPYVGEGQWDLSDELNAGYSDDVYGGFMQQMPVLRERSNSAVDLPSLSKHHHYQQQQQLQRSRHGDYADEYNGMDMEEGIRYVR